MGCYLKRTVRCGRVVEIDKYFAPRYGKRAARGDVREATPEDVAAVNERNAVRRLRWLLNTNFGAESLHIVLTYRRDARPAPEEARHNMDRLLRRLRAEAKREGHELRYIHVTEYRARAIHHHLIVDGVDTRTVQAAWPHGRIHATPLDGSGQYGVLAEYLVKETRRTFRDADAPYGKRWCASRNLKQPEITVEEVHAESWRKTPKAPRGYEIVPDSVMTGVHETTGAPWQRYWMIRQEEDKNGKRERKRE